MPRPAQAAAVQTAAAEPTAAARGVEATKNFISNLFTPKDTQTQTASATPPAPSRQAGRPAQFHDSGGAGGPAAGTRPSRHSLNLRKQRWRKTKPVPLPEPEETATPRVANAGAIRPASPVAAFSGAPAASPGFTGAAPVVPSGSFGSGFR